MSFSATVNLGTVGVAITSVKLYGCTGTTDCTGCTVLTGYENVSVSSIPLSGLTVSGIPNGVRYIQAEALGACSADAVKQCISISGIPGSTPVPTATSVIEPTPTSTTPPPTPTSTTPPPTPTSTTPPPTPTSTTPPPTPTATATDGDCYTVTYSSVPNDLYVRYRRYSDDTLVTELIQNLEMMDNGDGSYTAAICVSTMDGLLNTPICRQGGIDITCDPYIWEKGGSCTSNGTCFLQDDPTPEPTATSTPLPPVVTFSQTSASNFSSTPGTTGSTFNPTITVENATATIRLTVQVQTGYQGESTITISGGGSFYAGPAVGGGNSEIVEFNLGVGTYDNITWVVRAISDGTGTPVTATLSQV